MIGLRGVVLLVEFGVIALFLRWSSEAARESLLRKLKATGIPELPESKKKAIHFWVRTSLITIFSALLLIILLKM